MDECFKVVHEVIVSLCCPQVTKFNSMVKVMVRYLILMLIYIVDFGIFNTFTNTDRFSPTQDIEWKSPPKLLGVEMVKHFTCNLGWVFVGERFHISVIKPQSSITRECHKEDSDEHVQGKVCKVDSLWNRTELLCDKD